MKRLAPFACIIALLLNACSKAGSPGLLPGTAPSAGTSAHEGSSRAVHAAIVLRVPRHKRRGHYISPSTASDAISITPGSGCTGCTAAFTLKNQLSPTASGCSIDPSTNGITCTISFALKPGSYTGSIATYDSWTAGAPSGKVLSQNQSFPIVVSAGKANIPRITLSGVAASIQVVPLSSDLAAFGDIGGSSFRLEIVPQHVALLLAEAFDADGNAIFGPGSPSFTVTVGNGITSSVVGNNIRLTAPANLAKGAFPITIATASCSVGNVCSTQNWTISASPLVAQASLTPAAVQIYAGLSNKLYATIPASAGLSAPSAEAFDSKGDLFVANKTGGAGGSITVYAPPYNESAPTATITSGISGPTALIISPTSDRLAVLNSGGGGSVAVYASGAVTPISAPHATGGVPLSIALDKSDNLWYSTTGSGTIQVLLAASGYATSGGSVSIGGSPAAIALDQSNNLTVADSGSGNVTEYQAPGYSTSRSVASGLSNPPLLAYALHPPQERGLGSNEALLGVAAPNYLGEWSGDGSDYATTFSGSCSALELMAFDQDGNMWVDAPFNAGGDIYFFTYTSLIETNTYTTYPPSALAVFPSD